jgi:uncharacterized Zn-binding protein involved in type VI secretion
MHGGIVTVGFPTVLIGGPPASRIGDMHTCPLVTVLVPHVGGPFILGAFTVLTGNMPQSRQTDMLVCVGPPDSLAMGCPTVLVGMAGGGGLGGLLAGAGMALGQALFGDPYPRAVRQDDGSVVTEYNEFVTIEGSAEFQATIVSDLDTFTSTKTGQAWEQAYAKEAKEGHSITIRPMPPTGAANNGFATPADNNGLIGADNATPGSGTSTVLEVNPAQSMTYRAEDGSLQELPFNDVLGHECIHALHGAQGMDRYDHKLPGPYSDHEEASTIGVHGYEGDDITERNLVGEDGRPVRPDHNSIEETTYKGFDGKWYHETEDANGNKQTTEIPPPDDIGWRPNQ